MSNPFEPPGGGRPGADAVVTRPIRHTGDFDLGLALRDGISSLRRNLGAWFGAWLVGALILLASALLCLVPLIFTIPLFTVGWTRFALQAGDGRAEVRTVLSGFDDWSRWFPPTLLLLLLLLLIGAPGFLASQAASFGLGTLVPATVPDPNDTEAMLALIGQQMVVGQVAGLVALVWQALVQVRFLPSLFLLVERGTDAVQSLSEGFGLTRGSGLKLAVLEVLLYFVSLLVPLVGLVFCLVGVIPAVMVVGMYAAAVRASVYRQLTGTRVAVG